MSVRLIDHIVDEHNIDINGDMLKKVKVNILVCIFPLLMDLLFPLTAPVSIGNDSCQLRACFAVCKL